MITSVTNAKAGRATKGKGMAPDRALEERVLIVAPAGRDAAQARRILSSVAVSTVECEDVVHLCEELARGVGAAIIAEEALSPSATERLGQALANQPAWSDVPVVVVAGAKTVAGDGGLLAPHLATIGNVTVLARPIRMIALVSAVGGALRARRRQYELRGLLEAREAEVRQRDEFLAMLGHELRNPLAAICLAGETMERTGVEVFERERAMIARQTRHLSRLVDDLLDVARLTSGKVSLQKASLSLGEVVRRALQAVEGAASGHRLCVDLHSEGLVIDGDAVRLEQVVTNLVTNAIKYTPPGGDIRVSLQREGDDAVLRVSDTGVGIAPDLLTKVFEMFVQADHTLDRARGGMGLGLTLVRRLVKLHGGEVTAQSDGVGRGATFVVRLPLEGSAARPCQRMFAFKAGPSAPRRVVVVEDNDDFREALIAGLEGFGHQVTSASDGPSGLALLLETRPEVAVVDIGLPQLDGYSVARRARASLGRSVTLIALTGYGQPEDKERALAAGFDVHLTKPLDLAALQSLLAPAHRPGSVRVPADSA